MALRWVIHSACHALGYQSGSDQVVSYTSSGGGGDHQVKSFNKVSPNNKGTTNSTASSCKEEKNNTIVIQSDHFQMPLHYPRYIKADYEKMEEWKLDLLLNQYGIPNINGSLDDKRAFAMGTFLWPNQY